MLPLLADFLGCTPSGLCVDPRVVLPFHWEYGLGKLFQLHALLCENCLQSAGPWSGRDEWGTLWTLRQYRLQQGSRKGISRGIIWLCWFPIYWLLIICNLYCMIYLRRVWIIYYVRHTLTFLQYDVHKVRLSVWWLYRVDILSMWTTLMALCQNCTTAMHSDDGEKGGHW